VIYVDLENWSARDPERVANFVFECGSYGDPKIFVTKGPRIEVEDCRSRIPAYIINQFSERLSLKEHQGKERKSKVPERGILL